MKRAYSVDNVLNAKFHTLEFEGQWKDALGCPELSGSWFIYGDIKNGKTSLAMQLAKYLTKFERVLYNSTEEGLSLSMQETYKRFNMKEVSRRMMLRCDTDINELIKKLEEHKSPNIIFIDTIQYMGMIMKDYVKLKKRFPKKLFIYVSHIADNKKPQGQTAKSIFQFSSIAIRVEGFKAFPVGRYGGGKPIIINQERAEAYWGLKLYDNR